jgi:hypothetical protein
LVELSWSLRRFLLEEMSRSGKGPAESREILELNKKAAEIDRRIYEAGADDARAVSVDREELRPFALTVRNLSARIHPMIAKPVWSKERVPVDTTAVYFTGSDDLRNRVAKVCNPLGLTLMRRPMGDSIAQSCWKLIQKALITVFDFSVAQGPESAAVSYEVGIARTMGKPIVILTPKGITLPFDVDVPPVVLTGDKNDAARLTEAVDHAMVWTYSRQYPNAFLATRDYVLDRYPRPQSNTYLDQTLRLLAYQRKEPDALTLDRILAKFVDFVDDDAITLIHPVNLESHTPSVDRPCW